jgi:hypothetical protein
MQSRLPMHLSPRCGAHARTTGQPCRNGAMKNGRCRMHGGKSTGPRPKHGRYTRAAIEERRKVRALVRGLRGIAAGRILRLDSGMKRKRILL